MLSNEVIENCWKSNPHGAGFMVAKDNRLILKKGFFSLEDFLNTYKEYESENLVAHFRWATHGKKDIDNCHPFMVNDDLGFAHNGVIHGIHKTGSDKSDTWHFNEEIMKPLVNEYPNAWRHKTLKFLLQEKIGKNNKLVFLSADGNVSIYNEKKGQKAYGCWFSNVDFKQLRNRNYNTYSNSDYDHAWDKWSNSNKKKAESYATNNANNANNKEKHDTPKHFPKYVKTAGKTYMEVNGLLIEQKNFSPKCKPYITEEDTKILCDNCNKTIQYKDAVETTEMVICMECVSDGIIDINTENDELKEWLADAMCGC